MVADRPGCRHSSASCWMLRPMNSVPSVARNGETPIPEIRMCIEGADQRLPPPDRPAARERHRLRRQARARRRRSWQNRPPFRPTRSMPPAETAKVMAMETMASSVKLLTRMLCRLAGVRKVGVAAEKDREDRDERQDQAIARQTGERTMRTGRATEGQRSAGDMVRSPACAAASSPRRRAG